MCFDANSSARAFEPRSVWSCRSLSCVFAVPGAGLELPPTLFGPVRLVRNSPGRRLIPAGRPRFCDRLSGGIRKRL
jgi:hypothetical protein